MTSLCLMGSNSSGKSSSQKLLNLAEMLRYSKDPRIRSISQQEESIFKHGKIENQITDQSESIKSNKAAVLICLFEGKEGELRVILTKRSSTLSSHSGEVALPGGKVDEADSNDVETALREAKEEIGLDPSLVDIVTLLQSFTNKKGISVVPVIGIMQDKDAFVPVANAAEVEEIFDAPLEMFLKDENRREIEREWEGRNYLLHLFDYETGNDKFVIWAITAGILIEAASLVYQRQPAFEERRPHFWSRNVKYA